MASACAWGCRRAKTGDVTATTLRPDPTSSVAQSRPSASAAPAPSASARAIAVPSCTPGPAVRWVKDPDALLACSPMVVDHAPLTLSVAERTPLHLRLSAENVATRTPITRFAAVGLPKGATLDARHGDLRWIATASTTPIEIGIAAIAGADAGAGECATTTLRIRVEETPATRGNLLRWTYFEPLRDADLSTIESDEAIDTRFEDGMSAEGAAAMRAGWKKEAHAARQRYLDDLRCGALPGGALSEVDVDGDGQPDAVFGLRDATDSWVMLRRPNGLMHTVGKIDGHPAGPVIDGRMLFRAHFEAEGAERETFSWLADESVERKVIDGPRGRLTVDLELDPATSRIGGLKVQIHDPDSTETLTWKEGRWTAFP